MDRERRQRAFNRLMRTVAVFAIGFGGRTLGEWWDRRHAVDAACAGPVPAGEVPALPGGGGEAAAGDSFQDAPNPSTPYVAIPVVHQPIGGGVPGHAGDSGVAVRLPRPGVEHRGEETLGIRASAAPRTRAFRENGRPTQADRGRPARRGDPRGHPTGG